MASEERQSLAALTPKRLQFLDDALWQVDPPPRHLDSDHLGRAVLGQTHLLLRLIVKHVL